MPPQGQPIQTPPEGFRPSEIPAILEMPVTPQTPEAVPIAPVAPEVIPAPSEIEVPSLSLSSRFRLKWFNLK